MADVADLTDHPDRPIDDPGDATSAPAWLSPLIHRTLWRIVFTVLLVLACLWALNQARDLVVIAIVACFLALAILPAVDGIVRRWGVGRGTATIAVILGVVLMLALLVGFLVPTFIDIAGKITTEAPRWLDDLRRTGLPIPVLRESDKEILASVENWVKTTGGSRALILAGSGLSVIAKLFLTLVFTIIIASSEPSILRAVLGRLSPHNQKRFLESWETAIAQTGGYFYSRLLLMVFTSTGTFIVMILVGTPVLFAIPLAVFGAFFVEFIPLVGGYIGIAIPVLFVLVEKGWVRALILLIWALIYQQLHDYVLSPRISARTMTLSPGVALGSALLGGALAGPVGALFAMPTAGMITAFLKKYLPARPIVVSARALGEPSKKAGEQAADPSDGAASASP